MANEKESCCSERLAKLTAYKNGPGRPPNHIVIPTLTPEQEKNWSDYILDFAGEKEGRKVIEAVRKYKDNQE